MTDNDGTVPVVFYVSYLYVLVWTCVWVLVGACGYSIGRSEVDRRRLSLYCYPSALIYEMGSLTEVEASFD